MKIILTEKGDSFMFKDADIHSKHGVLRKDAIQEAKPGTCMETNKGIKAHVSNVNFLDVYRKMKRKAQIMLPKDIAAIISETGIGRDSTILDCGSGSGGSSCFFANVVKKVTTYEKREDFIPVVEENIQRLQLKNIVVKNKDIYEGIDEKNLDMILLDLPEPVNAVLHCLKAIKHGGYLVCYLPNITQSKEIVLNLPAGMMHIKTIELIQREWEISGRRARPMYQMLGHTGFLSFIRRL